MADVATRVVMMVTKDILTIAVVWSHFSRVACIFQDFSGLFVKDRLCKPAQKGV